ncbi:MAG: hypothetical protein OXB88_04745 [Bacteriovoracales bacterium]|nr:hypothetical protein [Bacteriovoracales bacterium]
MHQFLSLLGALGVLLWTTPLWGEVSFGPKARAPLNEIAKHHLNYWKEGQNLSLRCSLYDMPKAPGKREKEKALRAMMSTWQLTGLDLTVSAIVEYAKALGREESARQRLYENLVGEYCSLDISWISRKGLKHSFQTRDQNGTGFLLPGAFMPDFMPDSFSGSGGPRKKEVLRAELKQTIALFRSFCGWGGRVRHPGPLSAVLKDLPFAAHVLRAMGGVALDGKRGRVIPKRPEEKLSLYCEDFICRRLAGEALAKRRFWVGGDTGLRGIERLYCHELRFRPPHLGSKSPPLGPSWPGRETPQSLHLMHGQLSALVTGVPEPLLRVKKYGDLVNLMRSLYRIPWDGWAKDRLTHLAKPQNLLYDPHLTLSVLPVPPRLPEKTKIDLKVRLLVAAGDFEGLFMEKAALKVLWKLRLPRGLLTLVKRKKREFPFLQDVEKMELAKGDLLELFKKHIEANIKAQEKTLPLPPLPANLGGTKAIGELVALELLKQLFKGSGAEKNSSSKTATVSVEFLYGPLALRAISFERERDSKFPLDLAMP